MAPYLLRLIATVALATCACPAWAASKNLVLWPLSTDRSSAVGASLSAMGLRGRLLAGFRRDLGYGRTYSITDYETVPAGYDVWLRQQQGIPTQGQIPRELGQQLAVQYLGAKRTVDYALFYWADPKAPTECSVQAIALHNDSLAAAAHGDWPQGDGRSERRELYGLSLSILTQLGLHRELSPHLGRGWTRTCLVATFLGGVAAVLANQHAHPDLAAKQRAYDQAPDPGAASADHSALDGAARSGSWWGNIRVGALAVSGSGIVVVFGAKALDRWWPGHLLMTESARGAEVGVAATAQY